MKNYTFNRSTVSKFNIKGILSDDGTTITYENADKDQLEIAVAKCLEPFYGKALTLTVSEKTDEDLSSALEDGEDF